MDPGWNGRKASRSCHRQEAFARKVPRIPLRSAPSLVMTSEACDGAHQMIGAGRSFGRSWPQVQADLRRSMSKRRIPEAAQKNDLSNDAAAIVEAAQRPTQCGSCGQ